MKILKIDTENYTNKSKNYLGTTTGTSTTTVSSTESISKAISTTSAAISGNEQKLNRITNIIGIK